jgi:hypothetical protein
LATTDPRTSAIAPVPSPTNAPQRTHSCQGEVITVVSPLPIPTSSSAATMTRRRPNRSMSAAANGAVNPKMTRLAVTAPEVMVRLHPNSCSSGSIRAPVEDRKPAAATKAPSTARATHQARWMVRRSVDGVVTITP